jgi:hypothetical protein
LINRFPMGRDIERAPKDAFGGISMIENEIQQGIIV